MTKNVTRRRATLEQLGVIASLSRPRVHHDNPFSEALFRTLKYRPGYPDGAFKSLGRARLWVRSFLAWYNTRHLQALAEVEIQTTS